MTASRYRGSLAVWVLLLAYASLYPFFPLRPPTPEGVAGFFLTPRYIMRADIAFNVIAYVPLGTLACLYFRQASGERHPIVRAVALAAAFSFLMEILQLFIPNRVSSAVDVASNAFGALLGALAFQDPAYSVITRPLGEQRERIFIAGAWGDAGLVLLVLWLIAQLNPALPFFGAGNIGAEGTPLEPLLPWVGVGLSICGFGLFVSALVQGTGGSLRITLVLLSIALWLKFAMASILLQPHFAEEWLSEGRVAGLVGGLIAFVPLRKLPRAARIYVALLLILAGALFSKIFGSYSPVDEFLRLFRWPHGQLGSFATLTRFLHELWPLAAIAFLIALFFRERRESVRE
jgi:VanZ family protein